MTGTLINESLNDDSRPEATVRDGFSWRRVALVAGYYRYFTDRQVLVYLAISVLSATLLLVPMPKEAKLAIFTLVWTALPVLFYFAPAVLAAKGDTRPVSRMLPARASERFVYLMLYFIVLVPAVLFLLPSLAEWLLCNVSALRGEGELEYLFELQYDKPLVLSVLNIFGGVGTALTCLFVTGRARSSRVVKGVLAALGVQFALGIIGAFYGLSKVFAMGFEAGAKGKQASPPAMQDLMNEMAQATPYIICSITAIGLYMLLMFWLNYRDMKTRDL